ncbi:MAG TPA: response regulator [Alphaproteobacteria bacterium]|nr:response regulator [Alphaproteobacteria bacterium]
MVKVLFVDDEPDIELLTKQKFRKQIANGDFDLLFAQNGQDALDLIKREPDIAVVVSDVNMPGMDGLTLLDKLKEVSPATKTIVVSAYGDTKTLRSAMNKGVFDFVTKPVDFKELGDAIQRTIAQYELHSTSLYTYQHLLAKSFPKGVDLYYPKGKNIMLWDAFILNSQIIIILGISVLSSPIPLGIAVSSTHAVLKSSLQIDLNLSLEEFQEKLSNINSSYKAHVFIGQYHKESHSFAYKTNGEFKANHMTAAGRLSVAPSQTALLNVGDVISLENLQSISHLSIIRLQEF